MSEIHRHACLRYMFELMQIALESQTRYWYYLSLITLWIVWTDQPTLEIRVLELKMIWWLNYIAVLDMGTREKPKQTVFGIKNLIIK